MRLQSLSLQSRADLTCQKCGFGQEDGPECLRCGIIFSKFKTPSPVAEEAPATVADTESRSATPGLLSRVFRILPWVSLTLSVGVLLLIFRQTPPLSIQTDPQAADRVGEKMARLQMAVQASQPHAMTLNEAEINSGCATILPLRPPIKHNKLISRLPSEASRACKRFNPH